MALKPDFVVTIIATHSTALSNNVVFRMKCDQVFDLITDTIASAFKNRLGSMQTAEWMKNQKYPSKNREIIYDIAAITVTSDIIISLSKSSAITKDNLPKHYDEQLKHVLTGKKIIKYVIDTYILHCNTGFNWKIDKQWLSQLLYMNLMFE